MALTKVIGDKNGGRTVQCSAEEEDEIRAGWGISAEEKRLQTEAREQKKSLQSKAFEKLTAVLDENERLALKERFGL